VIAMQTIPRASFHRARHSLSRPPYSRLSAAWLLAAASIGPALAADPPAPESVDFYVVGGGLRGRGESTWTAQTGFIYSPTSTPWGIGFVYTNDGHLENNHRDGFAVQGWYTWPLADRLEFVQAKADVLDRVYDLCAQRVGDFAIARRHLRLEWVIIVLLAADLVVLLVEVLAGLGTTPTP
jgi:hypothetical protein